MNLSSIHRSRAAAVVLCAVLSASCANALASVPSDAHPSRYLDYAGAPVDGFNSWMIDGFTPISRNQLVVFTGVNKAYLVKVWDTCFDLPWANAIGITSFGSRVTKFDRVIAGQDQCPIREMRPIDLGQMKTDLKRERDVARGRAST